MTESMNAMSAGAAQDASWRAMQANREQLSVAKWRKGVRAKHGEQLRLAGDYMRSLRNWVGLANNNKTLKARKAALAESLNLTHMLINRAAAINCCEWQLVNASCELNIRSTMSWALTALGARSFKDWQECTIALELHIADAVLQLEVAHSKMKALWKAAKSDMELTRWCISKCAKAIVPPVALTRAEKSTILARYYGNSSHILNIGNTYHRVSAAACINQRIEGNGTVLSTKNWIRLVRTARYTALLRASMFNDKQDYLVRLPVHTKLPIWCGSIKLR